jgi:hypothetical protein
MAILESDQTAPDGEEEMDDSMAAVDQLDPEEGEPASDDGGVGINDVLAAAQAANSTDDVEEKKEPSSSGGLDDILDDIFAEEQDDDDRMKAFGDLEHLTMLEVSSEVEAVLEEIRIRQGDHD